MLQIIVTGRPSDFKEVEKKEGSTTSAVFTLTEKRYIGKALYEIKWVVCVPTWKVDWARKATEKGYTVAVVGDDFDKVVNTDNAAGRATMYLMMNEVHML